MKNKLISLIAIVFGLIACSYQELDYEINDEIGLDEGMRYIHMEPDNSEKTSCFLFYAGGLVEPDAYIKPFENIVNAGYPVIIIKSFADLAILNTGRAAKIIKKFEQYDQWIIGGHSLGGTVAVREIAKNPDLYSGLVLMGAYPAEKDNISEWSGAALSITAENDGLSTADEIEETKSLLPDAVVLDSINQIQEEAEPGFTLFYEIAGGNHAQFGYYGVQDGDGEADISADEQHEIVKELVLAFFRANGW